ncbi:MAG: diacylglycerol kinase family protein [Candidatus Saccharimonadales bacterium]
MSTYSDIVIIYNPKSTSGQAKQKANRLAERLRKRKFTVKVKATDYAGHAEEIAYQAAQKTKRPLIISASGDGGYNEVINGVMKAGNKQAVCAILPSGNANDHRRSVRKHPLTWAILHAEPEPMDLLELCINDQAPRYAHSYIGIGITSHVASDLDHQDFGRIKEKLTVARSILSFHPVAISTLDGKTRHYDSLIFSNTAYMAKALKVGNKGDMNSGWFRVSAIPYRNQFWLFRILLTLILFAFGLQKLPQQKSYTFGVPQKGKIHLDGEIMQLPKDADVTVNLRAGAVQTIR